MSSETQMHNLLLGTGKVVDSAGYFVASYALAEPMVVGRTYTVSAYVEEISRSGSDQPVLVVYDGAAWWSQGGLSGGVPGVQSLTFTYKQPNPDHADPSRLLLYNTPPDGSGVTYRARFRDMMLVEGTTPAAWAPAEGETLAGGGAQMSANLWKAATANKKPDADGVYLCSKTAYALYSNITGASALAENQTVHMGASLRGADSGSCQPYVEYADTAGNKNWVGFPMWTPTADWQRFDGSCVVPSGMTITALGFNNSRTTGAIEIANPTFSYGTSGPILASDSHTPYVTQDHVAAEYATKAALKAAVTPIANGGTGATTKDGARKNLGIATVADVAWTDLWKDTSGNYVRWACRNNVVYVKWKVPQTTTAEWRAGTIPAGYRPSNGSATVAAWTEGNRMAVGWVDMYGGGVHLQVNSAQTDGTNQGSLSYPIF